MEGKKSYNGVIDLWKMIFCLAILVMHVGEAYHGKTFYLRNGKFGVEFFFIVSGFFMTAHVMRKDENTSLKNIGQENLKFMWSKIKTILPAYIPTWIMALVSYINRVSIPILETKGVDKFVMNLIFAIPNFMLLEMAGINESRVMGVSWYISAMLIVMFITYPMLRKWRRNYCYIAAPMIAILLAGYASMIYSQDNSSVQSWLGFMKNGLLRAFVSINLGCVAYLISDRIKNSMATMSKGKLAGLRIAEPLLYISSLVIMHFGEYQSINIINIMFTIAIAITMSGSSAFSRICNNNLCRMMGKLSLWIYLVQSPVRQYVKQIWPDISYLKGFVLITVPTIILSIVGYAIWSMIQKYRSKSKVNTI